MVNCDKFWLENPKYLLCDFRVIPLGNMSLSEQLNCLSRLVISVFLILYLLGYKQSLLFLILSLMTIIIIYYIKKNNIMSFENYSPSSKKIQDYIINSENFKKVSEEQALSKKYSIMQSDFYTPDVQKAKAMIPNQLFKSANQNLVGGANPKTKIAPINVAPIYEWNYWKQNDFQVPQAINSRVAQDFYNSGYYTENCDTQNIKENFSESSRNVERTIDQYQKQSKYDGNVNKSCGYNIKNLDYNLPSNYTSTDCQSNDLVKDLNKEIFTSTIVPGVYYKNEVIEPINYNIGISFDQQIPPRKKTKNGKDIIYTAVDPTMYTPPIDTEPIEEMFPSEYDVYDPRYTGYGTNSRGYTEKMTGQPRFFYDDVEAVRCPNYINRSNVDFLSSAYTYGPTLSDEDIIKNNNENKINVENAFLDNNLNFRTEMMTRLMRKKNAEQWQQRLAPISRAGAFSMGGMGMKG